MVYINVNYYNVRWSLIYSGGMWCFEIYMKVRLSMVDFQFIYLYFFLIFFLHQPNFVTSNTGKLSSL